MGRHSSMAEPGLLLYVVIGAVQGIVEWFPLSSSGQIALILQNSGVPAVDALSTALWIHFGSLLAIVLRFRREFAGMGHVLLRRSEEPGALLTGRFLLIGTAFTAVTGIPVYLMFYDWFSRNPEGRLFTIVIGVLLIVTGVALFLGARMGVGSRRLESLGWRDGALAGIAQGFAVLPGISRSGFTVAALLGRKIDKSEALRLSFLLDVPAIVGAMILTYEDRLVFTLPMALAILTAFLLSYFSMSALIGFARRIDLSRFCVLYGALAALAAAIQLVL